MTTHMTPTPSPKDPLSTVAIIAVVGILAIVGLVAFVIVMRLP